MKTYIIDGSNVLHKAPDLRQKMLKDYSIACNSLINMIKSYHNRYRTFKFYVFFDGTTDNKTENSPGIITQFSEQESADNLIIQFIKLEYDKKNISLVSSDTQLVNFARIHSIDVILSEEFLKLISIENFSANTKIKYDRKSEKPSGCGRKHIKEFLDLFSNADD